MRLRVGVTAALDYIRHSSKSEEVLEKRTQEWEISGDYGDAHFHECPAAGVYLGICCVVRCEVHDGDDSDGTRDTDTVNESAKSSVVAGETYKPPSIKMPINAILRLKLT